VKTVCLNMGELGYFGNQLPQTVDELTDRTMRIARQVLARHKAEHFCSAEPTNLDDVKNWDAKAKDAGRSIWEGFNGPRFDFDFFTVHVDYGEEGPVIRDGQPKPLTVTVHNRYKTQANLTFHWYLPEGGWKISPAVDGYAMSLPGKPLTFPFSFTAERLTRATHRAVLEITIQGRPTAMCVPVALINGNFMAEVAEQKQT
jgi:hypothetical protein